MENYSLSGFPDIYRSGLGVKQRAIRYTAPTGQYGAGDVSDVLNIKKLKQKHHLEIEFFPAALTIKLSWSKNIYLDFVIEHSLWYQGCEPDLPKHTSNLLCRIWAKHGILVTFLPVVTVHVIIQVEHLRWVKSAET